MKMGNPWKQRVFVFNATRKEESEKANDLITLLNALPPGQRKQLLKNETCAAILQKYGITAE